MMQSAEHHDPRLLAVCDYMTGYFAPFHLDRTVATFLEYKNDRKLTQAKTVLLPGCFLSACMPPRLGDLQPPPFMECRLSPAILRHAAQASDQIAQSTPPVSLRAISKKRVAETLETREETAPREYVSKMELFDSEKRDATPSMSGAVDEQVFEIDEEEDRPWKRAHLALSMQARRHELSSDPRRAQGLEETAEHALAILQKFCGAILGQFKELSKILAHPVPRRNGITESKSGSLATVVNTVGYLFSAFTGNHGTWTLPAVPELWIKECLQEMLAMYEAVLHPLVELQELQPPGSVDPNLQNLIQRVKQGQAAISALLNVEHSESISSVNHSAVLQLARLLCAGSRTQRLGFDTPVFFSRSFFDVLENARREALSVSHDLAFKLSRFCERIKNRSFVRSPTTDRATGVPAAINRLFRYKHQRAPPHVLTQHAARLARDIDILGTELDNEIPGTALTKKLDVARYQADVLITNIEALVVNHLSITPSSNETIRGKLIHECMRACSVLGLLADWNIRGHALEDLQGAFDAVKELANNELLTGGFVDERNHAFLEETLREFSKAMLHVGAVGAAYSKHYNHHGLDSVLAKALRWTYIASNLARRVARGLLDLTRRSLVCVMRVAATVLARNVMHPINSLLGNLFIMTEYGSGEITQVDNGESCISQTAFQFAFGHLGIPGAFKAISNFALEWGPKMLSPAFLWSMAVAGDLVARVSEGSHIALTHPSRLANRIRGSSRYARSLVTSLVAPCLLSAMTASWYAFENGVTPGLLRQFFNAADDNTPGFSGGKTAETWLSAAGDLLEKSVGLWNDMPLVNSSAASRVFVRRVLDVASTGSWSYCRQELKKLLSVGGLVQTVVSSAIAYAAADVGRSEGFSTVAEYTDPRHFKNTEFVFFDTEVLRFLGNSNVLRWIKDNASFASYGGVFAAIFSVYHVVLYISGSGNTPAHTQGTTSHGSRRRRERHLRPSTSLRRSKCTVHDKRSSFEKMYESVLGSVFQQPATAVVDGGSGTFAVIMPAASASCFDDDVLCIVDTDANEETQQMHTDDAGSSSVQGSDTMDRLALDDIARMLGGYYDFAFRAFPQALNNVREPEALLRIHNIAKAIRDVARSRGVELPIFFDNMCL